MRRRKRVVPGVLLLTALAAMRATAAQPLPEAAGKEPVKARLLGVDRQSVLARVGELEYRGSWMSAAAKRTLLPLQNARQ